METRLERYESFQERLLEMKTWYDNIGHHDDTVFWNEIYDTYDLEKLDELLNYLDYVDGEIEYLRNVKNELPESVFTEPLPARAYPPNMNNVEPEIKRERNSINTWIDSNWVRILDYEHS